MTTVARQRRRLRLTVRERDYLLKAVILTLAGEWPWDDDENAAAAGARVLSRVAEKLQNSLDDEGSRHT